MHKRVQPQKTPTDAIRNVKWHFRYWYSRGARQQNGGRWVVRMHIVVPGMCVIWFSSFLAGQGTLRYLPDTKGKTTITIISVEHFSGM